MTWQGSVRVRLEAINGSRFWQTDFFIVRQSLTRDGAVLTNLQGSIFSGFALGKMLFFCIKMFRVAHGFHELLRGSRSNQALEMLGEHVELQIY